MKLKPILVAMNALAVGSMIWTAARVTLPPPAPPIVTVEVPAPVVQFVTLNITSARPAPRPDRLCLALNIYHEARGEPHDGQVAVGQVTLNRTEIGYRGARSVCDTVFMRKQFSWTHENPVMPSGEQLRPMLDLADRILSGAEPDLSMGALHYYNPHKGDAYWKDDYREVAVHGNHRFMR